MKFLFTVHQFFPDACAGTEVLTLSVARELRARGHEVRVLTAHPTQEPLVGEARFDSYVYEGLQVYRFHHCYQASVAQPSVVAFGYDNADAAQFFGKILREYAPDVVHFFHLNRLGTGLIETAQQMGVAAFLSPTDFWLVCPTATLMRTESRACNGPGANAGNCVQHLASAAMEPRSALAARVIRWLPESLYDALSRLTVQERLPLYPGAADIRALARRQTCIAKRLVSLRKIVVPTQHMRTVLERHGVAAQRIACVPYGVDGVKRTVRNYLSVPAQPLRIGFIGTLRSHKGAHVLTAAFCTMPAGLANLVVYGREQDNPAYAAQLKRSVGTTAAVRFLDGFPNAEIGRVLSELDVLVVPSLWQENTPLVVHSALSARCPVVASRVAGISALIEHGKNGLLFEPGSATDLAEQLQLLVKDRGLLQTLSDQCKPLQTLQTYVDAMLALWSDSDGWLASNPVKNGG